MKILILSAQSPAFSAGLGQSYIEALQSGGHEVDYICKYHSSDFPENVRGLILQGDIAPSTPSLLRRILKSVGLMNLAGAVSRLIRAKLGKTLGMAPYINHFQINPDERFPGVDPDNVVAAITKDYDAVITIYWDGLISSETLRRIYEKKNIPIVVGSADMLAMTGGCGYFGTCRNFETGCGMCPELNSKELEDLSRANFRRKKENFANIHCVFTSNTWCTRFAERSGLFKHIRLSSIVIDPDKFYPGDKAAARRGKGIAPEIKWVFLLRSVAAPRKGVPDILKAFKSMLAELSPEKRARILVETIGDDYFVTHSKSLGCKVIDRGFVNQEELRKAYQRASYFISTSYDDAGPSMVNQAIMCGTPVICYDNGTAIDVIHNGITGFKTDTGNVHGLTKILKKAISLSPEEYEALSASSHEKAMEYHSPQRKAKDISDAIDFLKKTRQ